MQPPRAVEMKEINLDRLKALREYVARDRNTVNVPEGARAACFAELSEFSQAICAK